MGYMCHHAIIVTAGDYDKADHDLRAAHAKAIELGCSVTPITEKVTNGYRSFLVAADGSKEGWPESDRGDSQRAELIAFMETTRYEDLSGPLDWVEVQYGDDDGETKIMRHSDEVTPE
jgi:hypothetical protein